MYHYLKHIFSGNNHKPRRVVVTGLGVVSSLGIGWQEFWKNLCAGTCGISEVTAFDTSSYDRHYAGQVKNFDPTAFISSRRLQFMGRASQLAVAASKLALKDAGVTSEMLKRTNAGVCLGTTMGEPRVMEEEDEGIFPQSKPLSYGTVSAFSYPASSITSNVAQYFGCTGTNVLFSTACASGNYAIARASDMIRQGASPYMIAGGADALSRIAFTGFYRLLAMAPEKCQPFDKNRRGMMTGEGAAILVLEDRAHALRRGAPIYAEVLGYGLSCDAKHMTDPDAGGIAKAMKKALADAGQNPDAVDYVSAHGTGTKENDKVECHALHDVFGSRASRLPVSSIKSMLGHTMGAASAFEAVACCLAVKHGEVPPTIHFEEKDPECDIDCVPNVSRTIDARLVLNNSSAFGGNNACVAIGRV